ncbi:hypothetical protein G6Z34_13145 [Clostridium perfringens]|uniref:Uncharacterized protein n=1 Tax=Clostridium perfringens TaxID=1502 RepID=A0AAP6WR17_CLOPF|nr:hypothetical protein [Clostridium perfringens]NGU31031.1 hypothetical protein [Clostridium perfringens]
MKIKKWNGKGKKRRVIIMAVMTKEMLANISISSNKANDFIRESNKNAKKNREMLDKFREVTKMFNRK